MEFSKSVETIFEEFWTQTHTSPCRGKHLSPSQAGIEHLFFEYFGSALVLNPVCASLYIGKEASLGEKWTKSR